MPQVLRKMLMAVAALIVIAMASVGYLAATGVTLADARRETRIALGLPKFWKTDFQADITRHTPVDCPPANADVIVTGGQSNASNSLSDSPWKVTPLPMKSGAVMLFEGQCYELADPVLGATGQLESLWPTLAEEIYKRQTRQQSAPRPLLFIHGAVGTSQVTDWLDDRSTYRSRLVANITEARKRGYKVDAVLWIQGETDAGLKVDPAQYQQDLRQLMRLIENESAIAADGANWVFYRSTYCQGRETNGTKLEAALAKLARHESGKIHLGPSLTKLGDTYRRDRCHLNNAGRDLIAEETADLIMENSILSP